MRGVCVRVVVSGSQCGSARGTSFSTRSGDGSAHENGRTALLYYLCQNEAKTCRAPPRFREYRMRREPQAGHLKGQPLPRVNTCDLNWAPRQPGPSDDAVTTFSFDGKTLALANNMNNLHEHHILHTTYKLYW